MILDAFVSKAIAAAEVPVMYGDDPYAEYDKEVKAVLNQYWPNCGELSPIKRGLSSVYTTMCGTETKEKVVVKSIEYSEAVESAAESQSVYVNFLEKEDLNVAYYITPNVAVDDAKSKVVTVSHFLDGFQSPESLYNVPTLWWSDEDVVRTLGTTLANFRLASMKFQKEKPHEYEFFPNWDEINQGWQKLFTPITIDATPDNFGIIHDDLHTGNWMIQAKTEQLMDLFEVALLDFDNAQKGWYVIDIGTVLFTLNS
jgi:hypothetical protein